jgi:hypothetical protein
MPSTLHFSQRLLNSLSQRSDASRRQVGKSQYDAATGKNALNLSQLSAGSRYTARVTAELAASSLRRERGLAIKDSYARLAVLLIGVDTEATL